MSQVMNTKELAEYLKMNPATIRLHAENGIIPGIRIGRVWRFHKIMIDVWMAKELKGGLK